MTYVQDTNKGRPKHKEQRWVKKRVHRRKRS